MRQQAARQHAAQQAAARQGGPRRPGAPQQQPGRGGRQGGGRQGAARSHATGELAGRVAARAQQAPPIKDQAATPTIAQVVVAQANNIGLVRTLLEDLAKGVLDLSLVVGEHARGLNDLQARVAAIEQELGVEIEPGPLGGEDTELSDDGDVAAGDYDDDEQQLDDHAEEAA